MKRFVAATVVLAFAAASPVLAIDEAHYQKARDMIERSIDWLTDQQDPATGGWNVPDAEGPHLPAVSALVLNGMLMEPDLDHSDPAISRGVNYLVSFRQDDGGIYDRILPSYNTALSLSALSYVATPEAAAAIEPAQNFLKGQQWSEESMDGYDSTGKVSKDHPYYGGVGYGGSGRPDNSNLNIMLQSLHDSGLDCDDEAFQRALVFLQRTQMDDEINDMPYADGSSQGGFIYATCPNEDSKGVGESKAGEIEELTPDGETVSRLRAYGSITYAGFKSYIYADLDRNDRRVRLAYDWIRANYTLEENPGLGTNGLYYYFVMFSRGLDAWGLSEIQTVKADGSTGESRDWANDLIDRLAELQNEDGSFRSVDDRWMEGDEVLITAYALLALQHAID